MFWDILKKIINRRKPAHDEITFSGDEIENVTVAVNKSTKAKNINIPVSFLKRLMPVAQLLTEQEIQQLQITAAGFAPGAIIFHRGTEIDALTYIVKGTIYMEANNGSDMEISAQTFKALYPLSAGKFHYFTAIAGTDVTVIYIPKTILQAEQQVCSVPVNELRFSEQLKRNTFFNRFYPQFIHGELKIPSFPDIALKLRKAIQQDCGMNEIVKIVNMDPVISAKLIQVVNSPIYRSMTPITNCFDAINRLGLTTTRNLVTAFSMQNLSKSNSPLTKKLMQYSWMQSIKVSSISHTLALLTHSVDPDEALLAGLLHNIGVLPILTFIDSLPENNFQPGDIDACIAEIQGQVGTVILDQWEFPDKLKQIPQQSTDWFISTTEQLNLNDIVILAKYHNLLASPGKSELPLLVSLPAFQKLENQPLTPEMSLQILHDAKQQIAETMNFFTH